MKYKGYTFMIIIKISVRLIYEITEKTDIIGANELPGLSTLF